MDALGQIARSAQRLAVVRYLRTHPGGYLGAIQEGTGIPGTSIAPHLLELEAQGIIAGDLAPGQRRGRTVRYHLDEERLKQLLDHLHKQMLE